MVDSRYDTNGLANVVETVAESGILNYTLANTEATGNSDYLNLDSDGDGCNDVDEAGFTDDNNDGLLGPLPLTIDGSGLVTSGSDGYTTPADAYQCQIFNSSIWVDVTDTGIYSGTTTSTLTITNATIAENGNQYRVIASNSSYICATATSNVATLTIRVYTVITNRRITIRVNKN